MLDNRFKLLGLFVIFFILFLGITISHVYYTNKIKNLIIDAPEKCYTNLQPKPFLSHGKGLVYENQLQNLVKIEITNRDFSTTQSSNTGSMRPTISDIADLIEIVPEKKDLGVGDIIVFTCNGNSIRHRIIKIKNGIYTTKGDNNNIEDKDCLTKFEDINKKVIGILY